MRKVLTVAALALVFGCGGRGAPGGEAAGTRTSDVAAPAPADGARTDGVQGTDTSAATARADDEEGGLVEQGDGNNSASADLALPPMVQVIIPREADGFWNIDGRLDLAGGWRLRGVEIDNRRIHPVTQSVVLTDAEQDVAQALLRATLGGPRCEPIAGAPGERVFRITMNDVVHSAPAMWFREGWSDDAAAAPACEQIVHFAALLHRAWTERASRP